MDNAKPLALDVDGTFLRTDMLYECFWAALGKHPLKTLRACATHLGRRQVLKRALADIADLRTDLLPVNDDVAGIARQAQTDGREVVLASASDTPLVEALAHYHGLSARVFASSADVNLKGRAKAEALVEAFGERGFDYAGNDAVDGRVWDRADAAVVVGSHPQIVRRLEASGRAVTQVPDRVRKRDVMRALRPHQWVKNVLLLVPVIAAHDFTAATLALVALGVAAFSAAASSIYIINDLLDLEADRLHATKRNRPFASGAVPIRTGMGVYFVLAATAIGLGALLGWGFLAVILVYMALSLAYSLRLKRVRWLDIATLAGLYSVRVVAGAVAAQIIVSGYLIIFIFPAFLTLGCVKRLTEVTRAKDGAPLPGRGYGRSDRGDLLNLAIAGALITVLVFLGYSMTGQALALYPTKWLLWVAAAPLAVWLGRMVWLGYTGRQDYDPILFAMRDKLGLGLLMIMLSIMFYAAGLWQQWFS